MLAIKSEYFNFESLFYTIEDNTTKNITPIINHMANVFIPFFKIIPPHVLIYIDFITYKFTIFNVFLYDFFITNIYVF